MAIDRRRLPGARQPRKAKQPAYWATAKLSPAEEKAHKARVAEHDAIDVPQARVKLTGLETVRHKRPIFGHADWGPVLAAGFWSKEVLVSACSCCPTLNDPAFLQLAMEGRQVIPILAEDQGAYSKPVRAVLEEGHFVSRESMENLSWATYCAEHQDPVCYDCATKIIGPPRRFASALRAVVERHTVPALHELPNQIAIPIVDSMATLPRGSDNSSAVQTIVQAEAATLLSRALVLDAIPQTIVSTTEEIYNPTSAAYALGIGYSPTVNPRKYLEVVSRHRGELAEMFGKEDGNLKDAVHQINGELLELKEKFHYKFATAIASRTEGRFASYISGAIAGGIGFGPVGAICGLAGVGLSDLALQKYSNSKVANAAIQKFFGTSTETVQVWRIRKELAS